MHLLSPKYRLRWSGEAQRRAMQGRGASRARFNLICSHLDAPALKGGIDGLLFAKFFFFTLKTILFII